METIDNNIDFLNFIFPSEFLARYQTGVMIKKSWTVRFRESDAIFFGVRTLSIPNLTPAQIESTKRLVTGLKLEDLSEYQSDTEVAEMISYLDRQNLIRPVYKNEFVETAWEKQVEFFADFVDDPNTAQRQLLATSVCIIGVGGTGNTVIQHLASAGIQKFILIDNDRVEKGNFNRQFCFDNNDIGKPKVAAIKEYILARNPDAQVDIFCEQIQSSADLDRLLAGDLKPDVIVGCADTPPVAIQTFVLEYCIKNSVICTFGGLGIHHGNIGPLLTETSHQESYLEHRLQQLQFISQLTAAEAGTGIAPGSISYMAATVSSLMVADLIDLIAGIRTPISLNTLWRYDPISKSVVRERAY